MMIFFGDIARASMSFFLFVSALLQFVRAHHFAAAEIKKNTIDLETNGWFNFHLNTGNAPHTWRSSDFQPKIEVVRTKWCIMDLCIRNIVDIARCRPKLNWKTEKKNIHRGSARKSSVAKWQTDIYNSKAREIFIKMASSLASNFLHFIYKFRNFVVSIFGLWRVHQYWKMDTFANWKFSQWRMPNGKLIFLEIEHEMGSIIIIVVDFALKSIQTFYRPISYTLTVQSHICHLLK